MTANLKLSTPGLTSGDGLKQENNALLFSRLNGPIIVKRKRMPSSLNPLFAEDACKGATVLSNYSAKSRETECTGAVPKKKLLLKLWHQ